jgi:hypothetical protein
VSYLNVDSLICNLFLLRSQNHPAKKKKERQKTSKKK